MRLKFAAARKIVQFGAAGLLFLPLWQPNNTIWSGTYLASHLFTIPLTDPLAAIEVMLAGKEFTAPLFWSAVPLIIATAIAGRVFCGWICPLGTALELAALARKPGHAIRHDWTPCWILGITLLLSLLLSLPAFTLISPIGIISRAAVFGTGIEIAFILLIVLLEWFYARKIWCRQYCPVGALYGLIGRFRPLIITVDKANCTACGRCSAACGMGVKAGSPQSQEILRCTNCGECIDVCEEEAARFTWQLYKKGGAVTNEPDTSAKG